jgi:hypothetical protein
MIPESSGALNLHNRLQTSNFSPILKSLAQFLAMAVSQKLVNGKVGKPSFAFFPSDVYSCSVQAALFTRNHPT